MIGIYKITNKSDGKIYVGQSVDIQRRLEEHKLNADSKSSQRLYQALGKEGINNFLFETIEECEQQLLNDREKYWINYYQSNIPEFGYNMTIGGSKLTLDNKIICNYFKETQSIAETARKFNCTKRAIYTILHRENVDISQNKRDRQYLDVGNKILQIDKNSSDVINSFVTYHEAARAIAAKDLTKKQLDTMAYHISEVCQGKRKTAYGYKWEFVTE